MRDRIYPQFATHNAHTVAAVLHMTEGLPKDTFEFQRLHGMGDRLHDIVKRANGTHCRIYAPVGAYRDLLAYLVRRLLENGANSSFVNQIVDERRCRRKSSRRARSTTLAKAGPIANPTYPKRSGPVRPRPTKFAWALISVAAIDLAAIDAERRARRH